MNQVTNSTKKNGKCPFCGSDVDPEGWLRGDGARGPECEGCGATAPSLEVWNRRMQHQVAEAEQVKHTSEVFSVPRDLLERVVSTTESLRRDACFELCALLARPAERHQACPSEDDLIANGLGYPIGKEDAVKLHYAGYRSEVITILEAWEAIGHDIHINPDKQELMESLRNMAAICAAHGFDMPAGQGQHKGEPVWYMTENGLSATHAKMKAISDRQGWDTSDYSVPLYAHADPGEVAAAIKTLQGIGYTYNGAEQWKPPIGQKPDFNQVDRLRDQLTERDALLEEAWAYDIGTPLKRKIKAALSASAEPDLQAARGDLPSFANKVISKLKRFRDCAEDGQGADIGRQWFDTLVQLGLLNRVQRSPAMWEITHEGDALLEAHAGQEKKS